MHAIGDIGVRAGRIRVDGVVRVVDDMAEEIATWTKPEEIATNFIHFCEAGGEEAAATRWFKELERPAVVFELGLERVKTRTVSDLSGARATLGEKGTSLESTIKRAAKKEKKKEKKETKEGERGEGVEGLEEGEEDEKG